jgi:hypothetical protein
LVWIVAIDRGNRFMILAWGLHGFRSQWVPIEENDGSTHRNKWVSSKSGAAPLPGKAQQHMLRKPTARPPSVPRALRGLRETIASGAQNPHEIRID